MTLCTVCVYLNDSVLCVVSVFILNDSVYGVWFFNDCFTVLFFLMTLYCVWCLCLF